MRIFPVFLNSTPPNYFLLPSLVWFLCLLLSLLLIISFFIFFVPVSLMLPIFRASDSRQQEKDSAECSCCPRKKNETRIMLKEVEEFRGDGCGKRKKSSWQNGWIRIKDQICHQSWPLLMKLDIRTEWEQEIEEEKKEIKETEGKEINERGKK